MRRAWMALIMNCECGEVARGETEDELIAAVERHVAEQHPELMGKFSRDDILAMAEMV
jgi:predicted small metal-binding protein